MKCLQYLQVVEETVVTRRVTRSQAKEQEQEATAAVASEQNNVEPINEKSNECNVQCSVSSSISCAAKFIYRKLSDSVLLLLTVALMLTPIVYVYGLHFFCKSSKHCTLLSLPKIPTKLSTYFNVGNIRAVFAWYIFQALLSQLPVGQVVTGPAMADGSRVKLRKNGMLYDF